MNESYCRIGQKDRCNVFSCEWKKVFNHYCWLRERPVTVTNTKEKDIITFTEKKKEFKTPVVVTKKIIDTKKARSFVSQIKTLEPDDWIKKIKVVK